MPIFEHGFHWWISVCAAFVLGTVAAFVSYGCGLLGPQEKPLLLLTSLPPSLAVMAALLAVLQPQFSLYEVR